MPTQSTWVGKMVRLRQTQRPADKASWKEFFYSGELQVTNGEVETDNQEWIDQLLFRGFTVVDENMPTDVKIFGDVYADEGAQPMGTQVVEADTDLTPVEEAKDQETVDADESGGDSEHGTVAVNEPVNDADDESNDEPSESVLNESTDDDVAVEEDANVGNDEQPKDDTSLEDLMQSALTGPRPRLMRKE